MGRLGGSHKSSSTGATRPVFRVQYRKLVDDCGENGDSLSFVPPLPDYLSYCCRQCGHKQKLKVRQSSNRHFASKHGSIQELKIIHSLHFFRRVRKVAKSDYYLRRVCLSVRPSAWNNSALIERVLIEFDI
jgi:hypothetical protein